MLERITPRVAAAVLALSSLVVACSASAQALQIDVQSRFPPLMMADAPRGGAHPVGGLAHLFIDNTNALLDPLDAALVLHATGERESFDVQAVEPAIVAIPEDFESVHHAAAAGPDQGGISAAIGLSNMFGEEFGSLMVAGAPFGLVPREFSAWLYEGGGLALQQTLYDDVFDGALKVIPIAIGPAQGGGWFPEELPGSMTALCQTPWIVRWPDLPAGVWAEACSATGTQVQRLGEEMRCEDTDKPCPSDDNPVRNNIDSLAFGGFAPGSLPHKLSLLGQVDAFELNLPHTDVLMMKLALDIPNTPNSEADLTPVVDKTPYLYLGAWQQPYTYVEMVVNRGVWDGLPDSVRTAILTGAKASALESWTLGIDAQDEGLARLEAAGVELRHWPETLLGPLRAATERHLAERASGDARFARVLMHMRDYREAHREYLEHGDAPRSDSE